MPFPDISKTIPAWVIGFVVVALILHSIWSASDSLYQGHKEDLAEIQIHRLIYGFRTLTNGHVGDKAGTNLTPAAIEAGLCDPDSVAPDRSSYCLGPWGNDNRIMITGNGGVPYFDNSIDIDIVGLTREACNNLATIFAVQAPGLQHAAINNTETFLVGSK